MGYAEPINTSEGKTLIKQKKPQIDLRQQIIDIDFKKRQDNNMITSAPREHDYNKTMREVCEVADCALWVAGGVANGCKTLVATNKKKKKTNQKSYRKKK